MTFYNLTSSLSNSWTSFSESNLPSPEVNVYLDRLRSDLWKVIWYGEGSWLSLYGMSYSPEGK